MGDYSDDYDSTVGDSQTYIGSFSEVKGSIYETNSGFADAQTLAKYGCSCLKTAASVAGTAAGVGGTVGLGVSVVTTAVTSGIDAYNNQKTIAELKRILTQIQSPAKNQEEGDLMDIIRYCITKRTSQRDRQIAQACAVGGGVNLFQNSKGIYKAIKHTKGVQRSNYAKRLVELQSSNIRSVSDLAGQVVQAICGGAFSSIVYEAVKSGMKSSI